MEVVMTAGAIRRAKLHSNSRHPQTNTQFFYRPDALPVAQPTRSVSIVDNSLMLPERGVDGFVLVVIFASVLDRLCRNSEGQNSHSKYRVSQQQRMLMVWKLFPIIKFMWCTIAVQSVIDGLFHLQWFQLAVSQCRILKRSIFQLFEHVKTSKCLGLNGGMQYRSIYTTNTIISI